MRTIGVALQTAWAYGHGILRGVLRFADARGWRVVTFSLNPDDGWPSTAVDGWIGHIGLDMVDPVSQIGVPVVNVSARDAGVPFPRGVPDSVAAGRLAAEHMIAQGYRRLVYAGYPGHEYARRRQAGCAAAARGAGVSCETVWVDSGLAVAEAVAARAAAGRVGVIAANDSLAGQVRDALGAQGVAVPARVGLIGIDNDELFCLSSHPALSSVDLGTDRVGEAAASLLEALMAGRPAPREVLVPPTGVVARASSAAPAGGAEAGIGPALAFITARAHEGVQVKDVAAHLGVSRRALEKRFAAALHRSPAEVIRQVRLERVSEALAGTGRPLAAIARENGFGTAQNLTKVFKLATGQTPAEYRRAARGQTGLKKR